MMQTTITGDCRTFGGGAMDDVLKKLDAAQDMVTALCKPPGSKGAREWVMSIPARPDYDPDLVISDALYSASRRICELEEVEAERDRRAWFMESRGYRRCDIPVCNCNSWHGGHAQERLQEISDALPFANGPTTLQSVVALVAERDRLREAIEKAIQWLTPNPDSSQPLVNYVRVRDNILRGALEEKS